MAPIEGLGAVPVVGVAIAQVGRAAACPVRGVGIGCGGGAGTERG